MDVGKKVKALKKKLRQIEELEEKKASGVELNADQEGKVRRDWRARGGETGARAGCVDGRGRQRPVKSGTIIIKMMMMIPRRGVMVITTTTILHLSRWRVGMYRVTCMHSLRGMADSIEI